MGLHVGYRVKQFHSPTVFFVWKAVWYSYTIIIFPYIINTKNNNDNDNEEVPYDFPYLRDFQILISLNI